MTAVLQPVAVHDELSMLSLSSNGVPLDTRPDAFGVLRDSNDLLGSPDALQGRMLDDGYLFLPGYLNRTEVITVRHELTQRLAEAGVLAAGTDPADSIANPDDNRYFMSELADGNLPLLELLYGADGDVMKLYADILGGEVRHFDFTWMRAVGPGGATKPHCDIVYMGRGTTNLYTAWIPFTDITWQVGGLIVLENSHKHEKLRSNYGRKDVDTWCANRAEGNEGTAKYRNFGGGGAITDNAARIRERMGGRWLSAEYRMGDLLTFSMYTVHASIDNKSNVVRLSSDSRYQLASDPADERWIGEHPIGHGVKSAKGIIC